MKDNNIFDFRRAGYLLIRQLRLISKGLFIWLSSAACIIILILSLQLIFGILQIRDKEFFGLVMPFFMIGGFVFTSIIFSELQSHNRSYLYLMLPASKLEKLGVAWFISTIVYSMAGLLTIFFINFIASGIALLSNHALPIFNLFSSKQLLTLGNFWVTQTIFFLGAVYFRKGNFFKTILSISLISILIFIYTVIVFKLSFQNSMHNFNLNLDQEGVPDIFRITIPAICKFLYWYCMAPFFLLVSYFSLKEREV